MDTIKLSEENIGRILSHINCNNIFFNHPNIMEIKTKMHKCDLIKLKSFFIAKETISKMKKKKKEWKKVFENDTTDMGLIFKIYKQLMRLYV